VCLGAPAFKSLALGYSLTIPQRGYRREPAGNAPGEFLFEIHPERVTEKIKLFSQLSKIFQIEHTKSFTLEMGI
jgi:hypothetical protein